MVRSWKVQEDPKLSSPEEKGEEDWGKGEFRGQRVEGGTYT